MWLALTIACSDYTITTPTDVEGGRLPGGTWDDTGGPAEEDPGFDPGADPPGPPDGRVLTILLTLNDQDVPPEISSGLIVNGAAFVWPWIDTARVLVIRDDAHSGEDVEDTDRIFDSLVATGYTVDFLEEPHTGVRMDALEGYHAVVFSNPGHPPDDFQTLDSLIDFSKQGYGVILQGDDITRPDHVGDRVEQLSRLEHVDNGEAWNGVQIDNNNGQTYTVRLNPDSPLSRGLPSFEFAYGNDIDSTLVLDDNAVVATTSVTGQPEPRKPAITAWR